MARKVSLEDRCSRCRMRLEVCLCGSLPRLELATRVAILMHWREEKQTTNTGRIATLALPNSEIRVRGRGPLALDDLVAPGRTPLLLYPGDGAVTLDAAFAASLARPVTLIVPDGTWRQAAKVGKREPALARALRVKLPEGDGVTRYVLRRAPQSHCLSTLEAIARALGVLEGNAVRAELERLFERMVQGTLSTRTRAMLWA